MSKKGVKPYISRLPTVRLRQASNPDRVSHNPAHKPTGGLPAFTQEGDEPRRFWRPCPHCSYRVFTGPGEFERPDLRRSQHLYRVHGLEKSARSPAYHEPVARSCAQEGGQGFL